MNYNYFCYALIVVTTLTPLTTRGKTQVIVSLHYTHRLTIINNKRKLWFYLVLKFELQNGSAITSLS